MSKKALVTGGARGIGAAITRILAENGWEVLAHYNTSSEKARRLNKKPAIQSIRANLSEPRQVEKLAEETINKFDSLHLLVNNAALFKKTPLPDITGSNWDDHMSVNARAPLFLSQKLSSSLSKSSGTIINILDRSTRSPFPDHLAYMASKGALETLTRGLARALAPEIRVNGIAPGIIEFPEEFEEKHKKKIIKKNLLRRQGKKKEIAQAVLFLAEKATFTTGSILEVDGGRHVN